LGQSAELHRPSDVAFSHAYYLVKSITDPIEFFNILRGTRAIKVNALVLILRHTAKADITGLYFAAFARPKVHLVVLERWRRKDLHRYVNRFTFAYDLPAPSACHDEDGLYDRASGVTDA
jgi:hypothetical protein